MPDKKLHITDGLLRDNTVLSAGMIISPVIICTETFRNSVALVYAFSVMDHPRQCGEKASLNFV